MLAGIEVRSRVIVAGVVLALLAVAAPGVVAHNGAQCAMNGFRLEGECYHLPVGLPSPGCEPSTDNEHTRLVGVSSMYSGGRAVSMPSDNCGVVFSRVMVPAAGAFSRVGFRIYGTEPVISAVLLVFVDGSLHSMGTVTSDSACGCIQNDRMDQFFTLVTKGLHTVTFAYHYQGGPPDATLELDYLDLAQV